MAGDKGVRPTPHAIHPSPRGTSPAQHPRPHIRAGVNCAECHGDVASMEAAVQVESLSMGWCLDCHKEREASRDCLVCHY